MISSHTVSTASRLHGGLLVSCLLGLAICVWIISTALGKQPQSTARAKLPATFQAPLSFEPNIGQTNANVSYTVRQPAGTLYFTKSGVQLAPAPRAQSTSHMLFSAARTEPRKLQPLSQEEGSAPAIKLTFVGANPDMAIHAGDANPGRVNYLLGNSRSEWRTGIPTYSSITYSNLYSGISLTYGGDGRLLKGTYAVAPGADPGGIQWFYEGAGNLAVDDQGNLHVGAPGTGKDNPAVHNTLSSQDAIVELAPVAWQILGNRKVSVAVQYQLVGDGSVRFAVGAYDRSLPLIIDPTMVYSTYLGGIIADQSWGIAVDSSGNAYITGYTASSNFPTLNAYQPNYRGQGDGFVSKFSPDGQLVYSTYLGGSGVDFPKAIAIDSVGDAYIMGSTSSTNFPVLNAFQPTYAGTTDSFVTKLNSAGNGLIFSTYLGGSNSEDYASAGMPGGIAVDGGGNAYVTGNTLSTDFPVVSAYRSVLNGTTDAYVTKFGPLGTVAYSTYFGGEVTDAAFDIAVDSAGNATITGDTQSSFLPVQNAFQSQCHRPSYVGCWDAFVTKFNSSGSALVFSTYMGGNDQEYIDRGFAVTTDGAGNVYATGMTGSPDFPLYNPYQTYAGQIDIWIAKFGPTGGMSLSTLLGGTNSDVGYDIVANSAGNFYVAGLTLSNDFPVVNPVQSSLAGTEDAVLAKFAPDGQSLVYSTYFGGSNGREEWGATGVGLDSQNNVYLSGHTEATNFPTLNPYQPGNAGSYDAFITKFADTTLPPSPTPTACNSQYNITASSGATIVPGTQDIGLHCDDCVTTITLPFPFVLYGQASTSARVDSNGNVEFSNLFMPFLNQCLPADQPHQALMAYWDDLLTSNPGDGVYTSVSGQAPNRILNIEWRARRPGSNQPTHFEIRLYENAPDGLFEYIYAETSDGGGSATIGVQEDRLGRYVQYSCNTPSITSGLKLSFTLNTCTTGTPTPPTATLTSQPSLTASRTSTVQASATTTRPATSTPIVTPLGSTTVEASATATATATPVSCSIQFTDVEPGSTFYSYIECLVCRGIISGYSDSTFRPGNPVTRGQAAKIVANSAGYNETIPPTRQTFSDVAPGTTFWVYIERVALHGAISGYSDGTYRPGNNVTRGQLAKIDAEVKGYSDSIPLTEQTFSDVVPGSTFWVYIERVALHGVVSGYSDGTFRPGNNVTRGQATKIVSNTFFPECSLPFALRR